MTRRAKVKQAEAKVIGSFETEKTGKITRDQISKKEFTQETRTVRTEELRDVYPRKLMKFIPDCNNIYAIAKPPSKPPS